MTFDNLDLIEPIKRSLVDENYTTPTPIQEKAIPLILDGYDLLGCAQTGTGKTAAFSIPIIQHLCTDSSSRQSSDIKALILTPTRELAIQINECFTSYSRYTNLRHTVIFGGVKQRSQTDALAAKVDILIATPGRLIDLINQGFVKLNRLEFFVLDEADRMLDMGFIHDIKRILPLLPKQRQSLFFSATMPPLIEKLANTILTNPRKVEVTPASSTVEKIDQHLYYVEKSDKPDLLIDLLQDRNMKSVLVFTRTKHGADKVARILAKANISTGVIHGNKSQNARQKALSDFKDHAIRVLIATDIAARGIDVDHLTHVVNYELTDVPETYVHRIGRTGRAGRDGVAYSFCDAEEGLLLKDIEKLIGFNIPVAGGRPFSRESINSAVAKKNLAKQENIRQRTESRRNGSSNSSRGGAPKRDSSRGDSHSTESNRSSRPKSNNNRPSFRRDNNR